MRLTSNMKTLIWGALLCAGYASAQSITNAGVQYVQTIPVPGWSVGKGSTDLFGFNPVTRIMYLADRTNHGVDVIDTHTQTIVGQIPFAATTVLNYPLVAPDLQQLIVTDGLKSVYVFDLRTPVPGGQPDTYVMPGTTPDGMAYDTFNQTVYVVMDDAPYYLVGISLPQKKIVSQNLIPYSADLIAFNPTDGKIYIAMEDADHNNASAGVGVYDPATNTMSAPAMYKIGPACPGHGIDIDPVTNVAVMGCFSPGLVTGQVGINLTTGQAQIFSDVSGTDSIVFNPNLRRFYSGSGLNNTSTSGCPALNGTAAPKTVPILGVFDASAITLPDFAPGGMLDGVACTGRGNHIAGVDPYTNNIYVPVSQYPADPASATSGAAGLLLFHDTTKPAQTPYAQAIANLAPIGGGAAAGTVHLSPDASRRMLIQVSPTGVAGTSAQLTVSTTVTTELVPCTVSGGTAVCSQELLGDPLLGSVITLSVNEAAVASGVVTLGKF